jgi:hypothetical protein
MLWLDGDRGYESTLDIVLFGYVRVHLHSFPTFCIDKIGSVGTFIKIILLRAIVWEVSHTHEVRNSTDELGCQCAITNCRTRRRWSLSSYQGTIECDIATSHGTMTWS